ncbi:MAG: multidrug effflux MFS transporter [bacterium]|jgi:DHA1 family bicyclomycin/chloramphenicol resistance-like MFS transporter
MKGILPLDQPAPSTSLPNSKDLGLFEFVILAAMMQSLVALSVDAMLPALPQIGRDLQVARANDTQLVIMAMFTGFTLGQLAYGPLSDSLGRKRPAFLGFAIYLLGSAVCIFSTTLPILLAGRVLQGLGIAGPRTVMNAIVRDLYQGPEMARVISFIMSVFILVPAIAPTIGQGILLLASWRAIFVMFVFEGLAVMTWFGLRLRETLPEERRVPLSVKTTISGIREVFRIREALGYTLSTGLVFSPFLAYLSGAQQIFSEVFDKAEEFPYLFAILALSLGTASLLNSRLVKRFGMYQLSLISISVYSISAIAFLVLLETLFPQPPLVMFMGYLILTFLCIGLLFGNLNALAMQPLGHIAGVGASVVGTVSMLISITVGIFIGQSFDGTVFPLITGFAVCSSLAALIMLWTQQGQPPQLHTP